MGEREREGWKVSWVHFIEDTKSKFSLILSRISIPFSWFIKAMVVVIFR